jgi:predicted RNA-binding Zn-ribbon protein involved in translation (DUF1610 family)
MTDSDMTAMTPALGWPLLDRLDETFRLSHRWIVPSGIRVDGDQLRYGDFRGNGTKWVVNPGMNLLTGFMALEKAPADQVAQYAKRWGVLGLCQHTVPGRGLILVLGHEHQSPFGSEPCRTVGTEPLETWRWYAAVFRMLVERAQTLRKRDRLRSRSERAHKEIQEFLEHCDWLVRFFGCLRPVLVVENFCFEIKLGGRWLSTGLAAALTAELLFTLAGALGLGTCASCGRLFPLRRRARKGENSYCPNCGIRAAWREAQRRRRETAKTKRGKSDE